MDPGSIITAVTLAYSGAVKAWAIFQNAAHFSEDAEDLLLSLNLQRFRLGIWGRHAGLENNTLDTDLLPVADLLAKYLDGIQTRFKSGLELQDRYGDSTQSRIEVLGEPTKVGRLIESMHKSIREGSGRQPLSDKIEGELAAKAPGVSVQNRFRWSIRDKGKLTKLLADVQSRINTLNGLLTESQRRSAAADQTRLHIMAVGNVSDEATFTVFQTATGEAGVAPSLRHLVERRAIAVDRRPVREVSSLRHLKPLKMADFEISLLKDHPRRVFTRYTPAQEYVLLERKEFDPEIDSRDKKILTNRIQRLVALLSTSAGEDLRLFKSLGYIHDLDHSCWWIVLQFPLPSVTFTVDLALRQPVSMYTLLVHQATHVKPPLEHRQKLASQLASTVSGLFSSGWLHKGLRSQNVVFPHAYDQRDREYLKAFSDVSEPYLVGFDYTRQDSEAQTIDKGMHQDLQTAIYRHPYYQGEAASGYTMHYDIYSFGLILAEIAWWVPLSSFLDGKPSRDISSGLQRVLLSSTMPKFHREEAEELKRRVLKRVNDEMSFRVGTVYADACRWCLTFHDSVHESMEDDWHPALGFYDNVVEPMERLCVAGTDR